MGWLSQPSFADTFAINKLFNTMKWNIEYFSSDRKLKTERILSNNLYSNLINFLERPIILLAALSRVNYHILILVE